MGSPGNICAICGVNYASGALFCPRDGAPLGARAPKGADDFIGVELPGQIRIERLIGIGSMGRVYRAFQAGVGRPVAVKILHRELSANSTLVARFLREAQIASRLSHPNVVQAILSGQLPPGPDGDGAMYMVMEYLDGISLRSAFAAAGGALPLERAMRIVLQLCEAVGEAHVAGIVHRDLKPENVMLLKRGTDADFVKILDFGIARLPGGNTPAVTQAGAVFGTARYVSPEGAIGSPVGPPADVYAIATILYQALAGRTPFEGETAIEVLGRQINDPPPPLLSIAPHVPEPIAAAVTRNLAKRPEDRSSDAHALGAMLVDAARASRLAAAGDGRPGEPTQPQSFGPALAGKIAEANELAAAKVRDADRSSKPPVARPSRGPLAILLSCVAAGAALAAVGAYRFQDVGNASPTSGGGPQVAPSKTTGAQGPETGAPEAGLEPEGGTP
jgi:eukaryotic-like serine/threonine-protein kinase